MQDKVMSWMQQAFIVAYEQSLSTVYDLDLWASNIVFICNRLSSHDDHLCLFATDYLVMMIICAILYSNPTMCDKVTGQTQTGLTESYAQS